jgi:hypothetical protein
VFGVDDHSGKEEAIFFECGGVGGKVKKTLIVFSVLLLAASLAAQVRTGDIWGHVTDAQGAPLPGVSVTLNSPFTPPITILTDAQGIYRFPSLSPSRDYALTVQLQGFKKQEKTGIIVVLGQSSRIDLTLEQGVLEEEVTVVAVTPTVDAKTTAVGKNVTQEILQSLPSSRDPWNVMQMAPSIMMDRENVGGNESGQQAGYYAKGDSSGGANNVWSLDGVVVTDPAAIGASPIYWDFDSFDSMKVVTGGADVSVQTGAVALNMVTRRGGNKVTFGGRFYLTDSKFQAIYSPAKLAEKGAAGFNKVNQIKDYGFNFGGPVIKDHVWLWMSYGIQDIDAVLLNGSPQKPLLTDYTFKLNVQPIPSNRFEAMWVAGAKRFIGRSASQSYPEGLDQDSPFHFGAPIAKVQDEQMIGSDLLISAKFGYMNAAFQLIPHSDPNGEHLVNYNVTNDLWIDNWYYITRRPMYDVDGHIQYYNDKLFNVSHEIKLGVEYSTRRVTTDSATPGNIYEYYNLNYPDVDFTGQGNPGLTPGMTQWFLRPDYNLDYGVKQLTAFFQDTITAHRFNFLLGIRYDHQVPSINSSTYATVNSNPVWDMIDPAAAAALKAFWPGTTVPNIKPDYRWNVWSPRLGITYDLFGTGKTILKVSGAMYGDFMGSGSAAPYFNPYGAASGWLNWWWLDGYNGNPADGIMQAGEMFGNDPDTFAPIPLFSGGAVSPGFVAQQFNQWGGFTPGVSAPQPSRYTVASDATSTRTGEILATLEHELLTDFSIGLDFTYRKYDHFTWTSDYYTNGPFGDYRVNGQSVILGPDSSAVAGQVPSSIAGANLGAGAGRDYYMLKPEFSGTPYRYRARNTNYETYWGVDLIFNKRLSNKWMLDGSLSYQDQTYHYGNGYTNPTNLWALDDHLYAPAIGGTSGKINQYIFSHWMGKLEGLYQLPYGFNVSFTFNARAGHVIPHYMYITNNQWPNASARANLQVYLDEFGNTTLPFFAQLNMRLEKMVKLGETGRIYIMADAFNVLNSAIINRRYDQREGTYTINANGTTKFSTYANNFTVNELLNPFIARFGVRFQF